MPLYSIPNGTIVHNIELHPGRGGQLCRSAGTYAQIIDKEEKYVMLRLPSGEIRKVLAKCFATVGQVGNIDHENIKIGKAGRNRYLNKRPKVRGVAMNQSIILMAVVKVRRLEVGIPLLHGVFQQRVTKPVKEINIQTN